MVWLWHCYDDVGTTSTQCKIPNAHWVFCISSNCKVSVMLSNTETNSFSNLCNIRLFSLGATWHHPPPILHCPTWTSCIPTEASASHPQSTSSQDSSPSNTTLPPLPWLIWVIIYVCDFVSRHYFQNCYSTLSKVAAVSFIDHPSLSYRSKHAQQQPHAGKWRNERWPQQSEYSVCFSLQPAPSV